MLNPSRSCCCGGCFAIDDCPLPFAYEGDFTYELEVSNNEVDGTFAQSRVKRFSIQDNFVACYPITVESIGSFTCPSNYPDCDNGGILYRTDTYAFTGMLPPTVISQIEQFPCWTTCPEGPGVNVTCRKVCPQDRWSKLYTFDNNNCVPCPGDCGISFLDCDIVPENYIYANYTDGGAPCGDYEVRVDPAGVMGDLFKAAAKVRFKRVAQSQFVGEVISGEGVEPISYSHRTNICHNEPDEDCGLCTLGGAVLPCITGVCCCRAYISFNWRISRPVSYYGWAFNGAIGDYVYTLTAVPDCVQEVRLYYEGPVDVNLYNTSSPLQSVREFRLMAGRITQVQGQPITNTVGFYGHDACGNPVTFGIPPSSDGETINYDCEPCSDSPITGQTLTAEQLVTLGINQTINVSRVLA
jgi:hypothetical protein